MQTLAHARTGLFSYSDLDETLRKGLKSADPTTYSVLYAVNEIYQQHAAVLDKAKQNVGFIYYGSAYPKITTARIVNDLANKGRVSPVDFINANAGAAASICCTRFGFQGPSMVLTMPAITSESVARGLALHWLNTRHAEYLFLVAADFTEGDTVQVSASLLSH